MSRSVKLKLVKIEIPDLCLVVLIGASGAGKSSFARRHFLPTEIISSDFCRGLVCDDETSLEASADAFKLVHEIASLRLKNGKLTVIDATNVQKEARAPLLALAKRFFVQSVALVLDVPEEICHERNQSRPDRDFGPHVTRNHARQLRQSLRHLEKDGFRYLRVLRGDDIDNAEIVRTPLWNNKKIEAGPFDVIGDIHGCADELEELLAKLGYARDGAGVYRHPENRQIAFVGDLGDRGPRSADVFRIAMNMTKAGTAWCVSGNHDDKLKRYLSGKKTAVTHGLQETLDDLEKQPDEFKNELREWLNGLISHYVFDDGNLVIAHAGLKEAMQGRASGAVRSFCLYGETTGETDEWGLPERLDWAREYKGSAAVVYGHTPVPRATWLNNTLNIDTGCVFGGALTALRWPEREIISVPARREYAESVRPIWATETEFTPQQRQDEVLDIGDYLGKRLIETRLGRNITIRAENSAAALEVMSRFAADPKWLIYLPPTMAPVATSQLPDYLEHPDQAWNYFRGENVSHVVCEEKHMGSRAVVIVARDKDAARIAFGVEGDGAILTRTGRRFFDDLAIESALLERLRGAISRADWWDNFESDWFVLDCELMPWSAKARELIRHQYAPVGAAGELALSAANSALDLAAARGLEIGELKLNTAARLDALEKYRAAYARYCWEVNSLDDYRLAPFHLLASRGKVHVDLDHVWHMETLAQLAESEPTIAATPFVKVELADVAAVENATKWWEKLTNSGGEGMVVKPLQFVTPSGKGLVQPAVKVRGREYLRIIYGPEYLLPRNLDRLRARGLGAKRSLALREFALGIEALERFVQGEPLQRVHECVFGVLALESEPVDPRL